MDNQTESQLYQHPLYYEIAFGFIDPATSVDLMQEYIDKYSGAQVQTVLEICCGPALQLREFARRGYHAIGLDINQAMLDYVSDRAREDRTEIELIKADMRDFSLSSQVDFCYNMMGSIVYVGSNAGLVSHLSEVARALKPGGLYLIENMVIHWNSHDLWKPITWEMERDGVSVLSTYHIKLANSLEQTVHQTIQLDIDNHGEQIRLVDEGTYKLICPQEFATLVELQGEFEFLGFFERDSTEKLTAAAPDNIALLRRL